MGDVVVAEVVRSGFVESVHRGSAVVLDPAGAVSFAVGDPAAPVFLRSAAKPVQAVALLRAGLTLPPPLLALAAASHSGGDVHLAAAARILALAALDPAALANTPDLPLGPAERVAWLRAGLEPSRLAQNCSGQHAAMLLTCVDRGWATDGYLAADHPMQGLLAVTLADLTGERAAATGVDGCGTTTPAHSLTGLARAFAALATAPDGTPEAAVAGAVRAHPDLLGGAGRPVTDLLRAVPGLVAKDGAEAVFAGALPDGRAFAVKVSDGGARAEWPVVAALLRRLGADVPASVADVPVLGHGAPVGRVRAVGI